MIKYVPEINIIVEDNDEDHSNETEEDLIGSKAIGRVAEVEVAIAELLSTLPITISLAFFIINFVFC